MDRPGVRQVPEGSGEQGKIERTGCAIICSAPTTLSVKGWMDADDDELRGLQLVQNTAARFVTLIKMREHVKPVLKKLHWLLVKDRIDHKIFSLVHNCIRCTAMQYLQELIPCCEAPRSLQ